MPLNFNKKLKQIFLHVIVYFLIKKTNYFYLERKETFQVNLLKFYKRLYMLKMHNLHCCERLRWRGRWDCQRRLRCAGQCCRPRQSRLVPSLHSVWWRMSWWCSACSPAQPVEWCPSTSRCSWTSPWRNCSARVGSHILPPGHKVKRSRQHSRLRFKRKC